MRRDTLGSMMNALTFICEPHLGHNRSRAVDLVHTSEQFGRP